uniref:Fimbrial protein n=1 Tax=Steinernema glaseri TaxID=37863 RepID=A0A1I7YPN4_9BILA
MDCGDTLLTERKPMAKIQPGEEEYIEGKRGVTTKNGTYLRIYWKIANFLTIDDTKVTKNVNAKLMIPYTNMRADISHRECATHTTCATKSKPFRYTPSEKCDPCMSKL